MKSAFKAAVGLLTSADISNYFEKKRKILIANLLRNTQLKDTNICPHFNLYISYNETPIFR